MWHEKLEGVRVLLQVQSKPRSRHDTFSWLDNSHSFVGFEVVDAGFK